MLDYKKIIKSRAVRGKILDALRFVPDKLMLEIQYWMKTGRKLNLKNPERFTEKIQWYKMYYRNPIMHQCVDKFLVRQYVKDKGLEEILIPLIGHYNTIDDIDVEALPACFVMKTTHGGGGLNVVVCDNKAAVNWCEVKQKLSFKRKPVKLTGGREWAYNGLMPGVVIEELLINLDRPEAGMNDYKIFCFDGKPRFIVVDIDRYVGHKRNFYDMDWKNLHIGSDCPTSNRELQKPIGFERMMEIAEKLSEGFPFVRVDLYNNGGKIYFGELTFYPWSGYVQFEPDSFDYELGKPMVIPK